MNKTEMDIDMARIWMGVWFVMGLSTAFAIVEAKKTTVAEISPKVYEMIGFRGGQVCMKKWGRYGELPHWKAEYPVSEMTFEEIDVIADSK